MLLTSIRRSLIAGGLVFTALSTITGAPAFAQQNSLSKEEARKIIEPIYSMFNRPQTKDLKALSDIAFMPEWRSCSGLNVCKTREAFLGQLGFFGKLIPDLKWEIKELMVDGDRITVIGEGSGTPADAFFGVPHSGKSFKIMAIDVHTVKNGKLVSVHHVEDWAGAMQQLRTQ